MERKSLDSNFGNLANQALQLNRGFMKRPISVSDLLSYQKKTPKKPLTNSTSKVVLKVKKNIPLIFFYYYLEGMSRMFQTRFIIYFIQRRE